MTRYMDKSFDWVAALAFGSGVVVVVASLTAVTIAVLAVIATLV